MKTKVFLSATLVFLVIGGKSLAQLEVTAVKSQRTIDHLSLNSNGKTAVVKQFPDDFPDVLTQRGEPIIYTKENSNNFEYIGMP